MARSDDYDTPMQELRSENAELRSENAELNTALEAVGLAGGQVTERLVAARAEIERLKAELKADSMFRAPRLLERAERAEAALQSLKEEYEIMRQDVIKLSSENVHLKTARRDAITECAYVFDDRPDIKTAERRIAALLKKAGPY